METLIEVGGADRGQLDGVACLIKRSIPVLFISTQRTTAVTSKNYPACVGNTKPAKKSPTKTVAVLALACMSFIVWKPSLAQASESGFVKAIDSIGYYATGCPGCAQDAISVGYRACAAWDQGGEMAAIRTVIKAYNGPGQPNAAYHATLFAQYAAQELCQKHRGEIGPI